MTKAFASQADLTVKKITFDKLADGVYGYTAEGDPNAAVVIGDDEVMVVDTLATPVQARRLIRQIRKVTRKPITYLVLTHYHAVRVLGATAYGAREIIASRGTYELIKERGAQDFKSEVERFPRLFEKVETVPGLTWPTMVFDGELTIWMGKREVRIMHLGRGHTKGDTVVWLPKEKILLAGDLVERGATPYCGDAYLTDWPATLDRLRALGPRKLVPGRGPALKSPAKVNEAIDGTKAFVTAMLKSARAGVERKQDLKDIYRETYNRLKPKYGKWVIFDHCLPFNVTRAVDEAKGIRDPRIWTARRDREMWRALES